MKGERIPWSPTLQRTITVEAGQIFRSTIFSGEGSGLADEGGCEPCKSLHVSLPGRSGTLVVRLAPESAASGLEVEVPSLGFRREDGSLPVTTERNVQVIVKAPRAPVTFELSTMFTPAS